MEEVIDAEIEQLRTSHGATFDGVLMNQARHAAPGRTS